MLQLLQQWKRHRLNARLAKEDAVALIERYGDRAWAEAARRANLTRWHDTQDNVRRPGHWRRVRGELVRLLAAGD
jgi:hypothetical protein